VGIVKRDTYVEMLWGGGFFLGGFKKKTLFLKFWGGGGVHLLCWRADCICVCHFYRGMCLPLVLPYVPINYLFLFFIAFCLLYLYRSRYIHWVQSEVPVPNDHVM